MYFLSINRFRRDDTAADFGAVIASHIEWTQQQIEAGNIIQAGKWGEAGGMAIIKAVDLAEAEELIEGDPLISSGLAVSETARLYPDVPFAGRENQAFSGV